MSHWIHVTGNIRFDSFTDDVKAVEEREKIAKVLGEIPEGSEGKLDIKLIEIHIPVHDEYGSSMCCARWSVNIVGDLRDVPDFSQIDVWIEGIKKRCVEENMWIRQGVIQAMDDNNYPHSFSQIWELLTINTFKDL